MFWIMKITYYIRIQMLLKSPYTVGFHTVEQTNLN